MAKKSGMKSETAEGEQKLIFNSDHTVYGWWVTYENILVNAQSPTWLADGIRSVSFRVKVEKLNIHNI